jgi:thioredoxin 2
MDAPTDQDVVEYPCSACGTKNRMPRNRIREDPNCGRCGKKVFPREPVAATDATWRAEVEQCPLPVLVDFWAPWCGPCRDVAPAIEEIAREKAGRLKVVKLNVDENPATASRFHIEGIPAMVLLRGPLFVDQVEGARPKADLERWLDGRI